MLNFYEVMKIWKRNVPCKETTQSFNGMSSSRGSLCKVTHDLASCYRNMRNLGLTKTVKSFPIQVHVGTFELWSLEFSYLHFFLVTIKKRALHSRNKSIQILTVKMRIWDIIWEAFIILLLISRKKMNKKCHMFTVYVFMCLL